MNSIIIIKMQAIWIAAQLLHDSQLIRVASASEWVGAVSWCLHTFTSAYDILDFFFIQSH